MISYRYKRLLRRKVLRVGKYIVRVAIAISVLTNVLLGGYSNQTFSARNYDWKKRGKPNIVWLIDKVFWFDPDHCLHSWLFWKTTKDFRNITKKMNLGGLQTHPYTLY